MVRFLLHLVLVMLLSGCSGVEWFPDATDSGSDGTSGTTVAAFSFPPKTNANAGQLQVSDAITVEMSGGSSAPIRVTGGEYNIDGGTFTATAGNVSDGSRVQVRHVAASASGETVVTTLTIGDKSATFSSTTGIPGIAAFSFPVKTNVAAGETITSDPVTLDINGGPVPIRVAAGLYQKNGGAFTSAPGTVADGDQIALRHIHPPGILQSVTTVTVGDESATFTSSTTGSTSNVPAFTFAARENVPGGSTQTSDTITLTLTASEPITVQGGEYRINAGAFTANAGIVNNGDQVTVRHTAGSSGQTVTTLTVGDRSGTFVSTTASATVAPFAFSPASVTSYTPGLTPSSNAITVSISNGTQAPISVSGGGSFRINSGEFSTTAGTVSNNDTVTLQAPAGVAGETFTTTLTIGDKSATFSSSTVTIAPFTFTTAANVAQGTQQVSNKITVSMVGNAAPISVVGGAYSINDGPYTSAAGTVKNGDTVSVRHTSAATAGGTVTTTLTIGETSAEFTSTTAAT